MPLLNTADALYMADREASHAFLGTHRVFTNLELAVQKLFAANEPGVWFDNADLPTLYEDSTGYFPASVNGLVGLQLDKRLGLDLTRRNLISRTQEFTSSAWLKLGAGASGMVVTDNVALAPDGTMTAATIVEGTGTVQHYIADYGDANGYPVYSGQTYTFSVHVKANGRNFVFLRGHNNASAVFSSGIIVDLTTGTIHYPTNPAAGGVSSATATDLGDGWWRITLTSTAIGDNLAGSGGPMVAPAASSAFNGTQGTQQQSYTGDGVSGLRVWGAQIDRAGAATDYQVVTTSRGGWAAGNHRFQTSTAFKPILRGSPTGANVILNGGFDTDTVWGKNTGWSITGGVARATNPPNSSQYLSQTVPGFVPGVYQVTYRVTRFAGGQVRPVVFGTVLGVGSIRTAVGTYTDWVLMDAGSAGLLRFQPVSGPDCDFDIDDVEVRLANADDVAAPYFLQYDGVDDYLVTNAIDFTSTDAMTVWAGVRKRSDAALAALLDFGWGGDASFAMFIPAAASSGNASFVSEGTWAGSTAVTAVAPMGAAPVTAVVTGVSDISGPSVAVRVNGVSGTPVSTFQGTGNYGNRALYMGRRNGTTLPYNGLESQLIVRGAASSASQIDDGELLTAQRTGVTLA